MQENVPQAQPRVCLSSVSWKKENFCGSPHPLSPQCPPAGITAVSPHLFLPPFSSFFPRFGSCLMVSHHKRHWQALSRMGSAWETGLSGEELHHLPGDELPPSRAGPWTGGFPVLQNLRHRCNVYTSPEPGKSRVFNIQGNHCLVCLSTGAQKEVRPVCHQYPAIQGCPGKVLMGLRGRTSSGMFFWPAGKGQHWLLQSEGCHSTEVPMSQQGQLGELGCGSWAHSPRAPQTRGNFGL